MTRSVELLRQEHRPGPSRGLRAARLLWSLGLLVALAHAGYTVLGVGRNVFGGTAGLWTPFVVFLLCAAATSARALSGRRERTAWSALGIGLALYALGVAHYNLIGSKDASPGFPSGAELLWLSLYPTAVIVIALLVRAHRSEARPGVWLDCLIGGFTVAAVGVLVIFQVVLDPAGDLQAPAGNLAFALGDTLVLGFGVGSFGLLAWRPPRALVVLVGGFAALAVQDAAWLHQLVRGNYTPGGFLDSWWLFALLFVASAALWPASSRRRAAGTESWKLVGFPFGFAVVAVALAAYEAPAGSVSPVLATLTTLALLAIVARFALTFRAHLSMIQKSDREAATDALTGLGNRRKLLRDAETALVEATTERPVTLAIFDLDGFKAYNDSYGHPAGDALLARLGHKVARAVSPWGDAYRLGGDEFCILVPGDQLARRQALAAAAAALTEEGEAFSIYCSYGSVVVPDEAGSVSDALGCADQRLYAAKDARPSAPAHQTCEVLRQILLASEPELDQHHDVVGRLATAVGRRLGIEGEEMRDLTRAAELHDIGKIAIPDAILHKPGPLTDDEWKFMRRHTTIGERFLASVPTLQRVARLVRSSHERYDGGGYPDGLVGEEVPLGSRIIFACDAYDAMTANRAYRAGMSSGEAIAELLKHSGSQFDSRVIEALCAEISASPRMPRTSPSSATPATT